ncbi:TRAP transporter substrate-binding protein DctP [Archangium lansingense]|uniref:TRAP transporter substrate-binding protein DctP n=1 Tax=Archangium lansingense TaxID=2995310 RepID=UPI003B7D5277
MAPKSSPWGQVFSVWEKAVREKSGGNLELQFFYNGGDEGAMVDKMKAGQLDGVVVTAAGLSKIHPPVLALQMPGLFTTWEKLDKARDAMAADFDKAFADAGFRVLGWCDVGSVHLMSKGFAVRSPDNIKGKKPYTRRDDAIQPALFKVIGGVSPVALNVPEVSPNLDKGAINIMNVPALEAEQRQWASKFDHIVDDTSALAIGAIVVSSKRLDALPADLRSILTDTGKISAAALTKRVRSEDDASYGRIKSRMTVITLTAAEKAKWDKVFKQTRQRLAQDTFSPSLVTKLEGLAK